MNRNHRSRTAAFGLAVAASSLALLAGCNNNGGATRVNNDPAAGSGATSTTADGRRAVLNVGFLPVT